MPIDGLGQEKVAEQALAVSRQAFLLLLAAVVFERQYDREVAGHERRLGDGFDHVLLIN